MTEQAAQSFVSSSDVETVMSVTPPGPQQSDQRTRLVREGTGKLNRRLLGEIWFVLKAGPRYDNLVFLH